MRPPPLANIDRHPTPARFDNVPIQRTTKIAKQNQHQQRQPQDDAKRPPIAPNLKLCILELNAEIPRHERHGGKQDRNLRQHKRDPRQPLDTKRLLDGNQVEIHHDQRVLLVNALLDLAQCVQRYAILEALEAHARRGAEADAERAGEFRVQRGGGGGVAAVERGEHGFCGGEDAGVFQRGNAGFAAFEHAFDQERVAVVYAAEDGELAPNVVQLVDVR